ncbi:MAG TPA: hypothetical protein DCP96_00400 [Lachnospiraceae bacterium]|nr:hypothetical protein [Lachnospiraceae bacterium]
MHKTEYLNYNYLKEAPTRFCRGFFALNQGKGGGGVAPQAARKQGPKKIKKRIDITRIRVYYTTGTAVQDE